MIILDTHTLLWFLTDSDKLPEDLKKYISQEKNVSISIVSLWEIAIKKNLGKLKIDYTISQLEKLCYEKAVSILPVLPKDLYILETLERIHNDPFDKIIVCQSISNSATIIVSSLNPCLRFNSTSRSKLVQAFAPFSDRLQERNLKNKGIKNRCKKSIFEYKELVSVDNLVTP